MNNPIEATYCETSGTFIDSYHNEWYPDLYTEGHFGSDTLLRLKIESGIKYVIKPTGFWKYSGLPKCLVIMKVPVKAY